MPGLLHPPALVGLPAIALVLASPMALAQVPAELVPSSRGQLVDTEFGVRTRQFGLQRQVQMYQWRREGEGFTSDWISRAVDSVGFPAGFDNPGPMPVAVRYWIANDVRIDGKPVDDEVLQALGQWRGFRPSFSALPGNMSATFQPEGDGLGTAENPQSPRIGDLRIGWQELVLPSLAGKVELRDGRWHLARGDDLPEVLADEELEPAPLPPSAAPTAPALPADAVAGKPRLLLPGLLLLGMLLVALVAWGRRRRS